MNEIIVKEGEKKQIVLVHSTPESSEHIIRLTGPFAEVIVDEIFLSGKTKSNLKIVHESPNTKSRVYTRGAIQKDQAVSHATVIIPKHAELSDSFVSQKFLIFDNANAEALPALEIEAEDVKAAHKATVQPINEDKLFYMTCRGLPEKKAKRLVVESFLNMPSGYEKFLEELK